MRSMMNLHSCPDRVPYCISFYDYKSIIISIHETIPNSLAQTILLLSLNVIFTPKVSRTIFQKPYLLCTPLYFVFLIVRQFCSSSLVQNRQFSICSCQATASWARVKSWKVLEVLETSGTVSLKATRATTTVWTIA